MPIFDYDFNKRDRELILTHDSVVNTLNNPGSYIRLTIYPLEAITSIVSLPDVTQGINGRAVFFSTLSDTNFSINVTPFKIGDNSFEEKIIGPPINDIVLNDFKIYENSNENIYIKPNEIFNDFQLPQGDYRIQIDFLSQVNSIQDLQMPYWFEEFNLAQIEGGPEILNTADTIAWNDAGRLDIAAMVTDIVTGQIPEPPKFSETIPDTGPDSETNNLPPLRPLTDFIVTNQYYEFIVKQVSTSRKEVRLKILDTNITQNSTIISDLTNQFNNFEPEFIIDDDENSLTFGQEIPNPNYRYQFKHVLNTGNGEHIPIMNYMFDRITDGKDNQSIILKLYNQLPGNINNLSRVTIEEEILTTQTQDIFYFSDVPDVNFGDGLLPDTQENWINPDNNDIGFQSLDELSISASIGEIEADYLISSSEYGYPNLNTDFNEFENHTFFGSAKKKLENFKTKVETIQGHYSEISSSLNVSSSFDGDAIFIIEKRKNLFNKIKQEFNTFTPYEKFLYFDGQSESTASAPSLVNYADTFPVSDEGVELGPTDGFNQMYNFSSENIAAGGLDETDLFTNKYFVQNKPFFNYDDSIYLSFLMKGNSGSSITWDNNNLDINTNGLGLRLPEDAKFQNNILNPNITGSEYQRYVFETSHSYFIPNTSNNDMADLNHDDFKAGSTKIHILSGSTKTGSYKIKDSTNQYPTTVVSQSGVPFFGSVMPSGELFKVYYKNTLSQSLQGYWNIDDLTSGSGLVDADVVNDAGPTFGDGEVENTVNVSDGVEVHGRKYGSSYYMISESGGNTGVHFESSNYNFNKDDNFSLSIWAKRSHPTSIDPTVGNTQGIFVRGDNEDSFGLDYHFPSNSVRARVRPGNSATARGVTKAMTDSGSNWHHYVMTYESASATGIKLYVDGNQVGSVTNITDGAGATMGDFSSSAVTSGTEKLSIGTNDKTGGNAGCFSGFLQYPRVYDRTITAEEVNSLYLNPPGITEAKVTDVKLTLKDPSDVLPFDNIFKTTSTEFTNWYNNAISTAETFDTNNIHSFENNLPLYMKESSDFNDMKDFLNLQGEQYDLIRNHIDSMTTLHKRGYKKTNSPPDNTLPMLLSNMGWEAINPFVGDLTETLGGYLSGVTSIDDIKNNTWRKTLNNLIYIYKSKGTKNSVRALLNTYGYPPDVLQFKEFGGDTSATNDNPLTNETFPALQTEGGPPPPVDTDLELSTGSFGFTSTKQKLYRYIFNGIEDRVLNLDWWMDDANLNTIEFVYKHVVTSQPQVLLESSGSGTETLWDLRLIPSSDGLSSSFEFRLNNSQQADTDIGSRGFSMSSAYSKLSDGELYNVMLQRMTGSTSGTGTIEYRLHSALQEEQKIKTYNFVTMSISGGIEGGNTLGGKGFFANSNFQSSGSRHQLSSSNLFVGRILSGSLSEIKGWSTALSTSKFRQHTLNKFSTVGNSITSHCNELVYHFKLNENYSSSSISSSVQDLKIVDASPAKNYANYTFTKTGSLFIKSNLYGFDFINGVKLTLKDNYDRENDNTILINPNTSVVGDLNSNNSALTSLTNPLNDKPAFKTSTKLELYRSPQNFINNFILDKLGGFNLETKYANPTNYYSQSYLEFDTFRKEFYDCYPLQSNVNEFIRNQEQMFNQSITEGLKTLVPARSSFSGRDSNFGVEIKPTVLERQKYEHHQHSVETNPNTGTGSISPSPDLSTSEFIQEKIGSVSINVTNVSTYEQPKSASINVNVTNISTYEQPKIGSISLSPTLNNSTYEATKDGLVDLATDVNESYSNVHKNWGRGDNDVHHINFASPTGSDGTFNTYDIDTRFVFHAVGDCEYYSASFGSPTDFTNIDNFYNHLQITDGPAKNVFYTHLRATDTVSPNSAHVADKDFTYNGKRMGKTRFMREFIDTDGSKQLILPSNHVTKFSQPFKEQMVDGTQNINPGFLNVKAEDYSSASFYRVKVTGGENQIYVGGSNLPEKDGSDSDDRIIY